MCDIKLIRIERSAPSHNRFLAGVEAWVEVLGTVDEALVMLVQAVASSLLLRLLEDVRYLLATYVASPSQSASSSR